MSEPTYRVELTHSPEQPLVAAWAAQVYDVAEPDSIALAIFCDSTREAAFEKAQTWCRARALEAESPSTVYLTEDGEIHDRFDHLHSVKA